MIHLREQNALVGPDTVSIEDESIDHALSDSTSEVEIMSTTFNL